MTLKLYNTLTRKKEIFIPINKEKVTMYTCGPTVYNFVHIGNLRAILTYDLLKRYLKYKGYKVIHVMNITDVDDKTIRDSQKEGKSLKEFTEFYAKAFLEDIKTLNIQLPDIMPKATEEIPGMIRLIKILLDKGYAYKTEKGVYFKISKFKDYGKLAKIDLNSLKENAQGRLSEDEYSKENANDFALWKAYNEKDGNVFWDTEIGKGRPGWHIECSVMSTKYLGQPFDIHMGGVDLIFPHHTNEIAQSEAAYDKRFCNYWVHNEHVIVNGKKMSKSLGNFFTLRDLLKKGHSPSTIRYELISTHYRQQLDFQESNLDKKSVQKFIDFALKLKEIINSDKINKQPSNQVKEICEEAKKEFEKGMDDDLNISKGLAAIFNFMNQINKIANIDKSSAQQAFDTLMKFDEVLGIIGPEIKKDIPAEILELAKKRFEAKKQKNYELADKIRDEIKSKGFIIEDTKEGYRIKEKI